MDKDVDSQGERIVLDEEYSEFSGFLDTASDRSTEEAKKFRFSPDPFTAMGQGNAPLGTFASMLLTVYRVQVPSALYIVPDFNYTTYGWNFPYKNWELHLQTREGVVLEIIRLDYTNSDSACPPRTVHFNHTYQARSDYLSVLEKATFRYNPPSTTIYKCWTGT